MYQLASKQDDNGNFFLIQQFEIADVFSRILRDIKQGKQQESGIQAGPKSNQEDIGYQTPLLGSQLMHVALFNLDKGNSMLRGKWQQVVKEVTSLSSIFGGNDLISCIAFNQKPEVVKLLAVHEYPEQPIEQPNKIQKEEKPEPLKKRAESKPEKPLREDSIRLYDLKKDQDYLIINKNNPNEPKFKYILMWNLLVFLAMICSVSYQFVYLPSSTVPKTCHYTAKWVKSAKGYQLSTAIFLALELIVLWFQKCQKVDYSYKVFHVIKTVVFCLTNLVYIIPLITFDQYEYCGDIHNMAQFQYFSMLFFLVATFIEGGLIVKFSGQEKQQLQTQDLIVSILDFLYFGFFVLMSIVLIVYTKGNLEPNRRQCRIMYNWCKGAPYYLIITNLIQFCNMYVHVNFLLQGFEMKKLRFAQFVLYWVKFFFGIGNIVLLIGFATFDNEKQHCHIIGPYSTIMLAGLSAFMGYNIIQFFYILVTLDEKSHGYYDL